MSEKEKNFVSAVVYLHNDGARTIPFFRMLNEQLSTHFEHYELIAVDNACVDGTLSLLKEWASEIDEPLTIIHMSLKQSQEACMNAGLHASIGDYVFEFDSTESPYPQELVMQAYARTQQGYDIVSVCPRHGNGLMSAFFYRLFNACSQSSYPIRTESFRVVTRRAINRVYANSDHLPYRKAAYATSGLKMAYLEWEGHAADSTKNRVSLAVNSLILYTSTAYRFSAWVAALMMVASLAAMLYVVYVFATGRPVAGWTTTMLVLSFGFTGLFAVASIIIKYLALLLDLVFRRKHYLIEGIEKIQH